MYVHLVAVIRHGQILTLVLKAEIIMFKESIKMIQVFTISTWAIAYLDYPYLAYSPTWVIAYLGYCLPGLLSTWAIPHPPGFLPTKIIPYLGQSPTCVIASHGYFLYIFQMFFCTWVITCMGYCPTCTYSSSLALVFMPYNFGPNFFSDMMANMTEFCTKKLLDVAMLPYTRNRTLRGWLSGTSTSGGREHTYRQFVSPPLEYNKYIIII